MQRHGDAGHDSNHITNLLGVKQYTNRRRWVASVSMSTEMDEPKLDLYLQLHDASFCSSFQCVWFHYGGSWFNLSTLEKMQQNMKSWLTISWLMVLHEWVKVTALVYVHGCVLFHDQTWIISSKTEACRMLGCQSIWLQSDNIFLTWLAQTKIILGHGVAIRHTSAQRTSLCGHTLSVHNNPTISHTGNEEILPWLTKHFQVTVHPYRGNGFYSLQS